MRQNLFNILSLLAFLFIGTFTAQATDLVVAAGGTGGSYASLKSAITAASANDRIIVYPQANGASYSEGAITINKSLQILSANEGGFYSIDGDISITPSSAGMSVTIIGMKLLTGSIQSTIAAPVGARCTVNLFNDSISSGAVSLNHDNYNVTVASNYVGAGVTIRFGKVIGNSIIGQVAVYTDASVNNPTDTVMIIGNKINLYASGNTAAIGWASSSQFFSIQNNFVWLTYGSGTVNYGIYVSTSKNSLAGVNTCINNTVLKAASAYTAYYFVTNANSMTEIQNNMYSGPNYSYNLYTTGGSFSVHYNYFTTPSFYGFTNDGTNTTLTNTTINGEGLNTNLLSNSINGGNPDSAYADINLTRNDVGCYGGSYTLDNFFPISANDWARVILVTAPRRVMVNAAINVKATGFDK